MISWGLILWLIGLSVITFFGVMWLLDISNRQRELQDKLEQTYVDGEGHDVSVPIRTLTQRVEESESQVQQLHAVVQRSRNEIGEFANQLPTSVQAVGLVRFQAFSDYGGDQSFALALADAFGNGAVITGIYAREGTRVYAKPLSEWGSSYSLSFEEEEAISQARGLTE
jgi:hypothetical protein